MLTIFGFPGFFKKVIKSKLLIIEGILILFRGRMLACNLHYTRHEVGHGNNKSIQNRGGENAS